MYLWIDPPGPTAGWIYTLDSAEQIPDALARHDIPADNSDRQAAYDQAHEGASVGQYQVGRDFWGITTLAVLPTDLPDGIVMVAR
jgi:hypothetical protein